MPVHESSTHISDGHASILENLEKLFSLYLLILLTYVSLSLTVRKCPLTVANLIYFTISCMHFMFYDK